MLGALKTQLKGILEGLFWAVLIGVSIGFFGIMGLVLVVVVAAIFLLSQLGTFKKWRPWGERRSSKEDISI